jgi:hypothetical protein
MRQRTVVALVTMAAVAVATFAHFRINAVEWSAPVLTDQSLWNDAELAGHGPTPGEPSSPIGSVKKGEVVQVIRDR